MEGTQSAHKPATARKLRAYKIQASTGPEALKATVQLIGRGIKSGASYVPLVMHARKIASTAAPKDYLGQLQALYNDFVKRWRYVHDPRLVEMVTVSGPEIYGQILGADLSPPYRGAGDCDDATVYMGAVSESIGLQTRVVTVSTPTYSGLRSLFTHVYPEVLIPKKGWIAADAVGYPKHGLGWQPPCIRRAVWDLDGNLLSARGHFPKIFKNELRTMARARAFNKGVKTMGFAGYEASDFPDQGLERFGFAGTDSDEPLDWSKHGVLSFGVYTDQPLPVIGADRIGLFAEYDEDDEIGGIGGARVVRTKMMEMDPRELAHIYRTGRPRPGTVALSDDGDIYQWQEVPQLGGFFKKLFKKVKRGVKKVAKGVRKVARGIKKRAKKLIKKLPGGKYIVKVAGKIKKVAMKAVKPILKLGKKLAPIAALIPGYGPAIAAALSKGPKILKIAQKLGIMTDEKGRPKIKTKRQAAAFKRELKKEAAKMERKQVRAPARLALPRTRKHAAFVRGLGAYYEN